MNPQDILIQRTAARQQRNYRLADELRNQLLQLGYEVVDTASDSFLKTVYTIAAFPRLELMQKYFFASYHEDGERWGVCLFPLEQSDQWKVSARKALAEIEKFNPNDARELEDILKI